MSIDVTQLKTDIKSILNDLKDYEGDQSTAIDTFSERLADKIADAVKRGIDTSVITYSLAAGINIVVGTITIKSTK